MNYSIDPSTFSFFVVVVILYWVGLSRITSWNTGGENMSHLGTQVQIQQPHNTIFIRPRWGLGRVLIFERLDRSEYFWPFSLSPPPGLRVLRTAGHGGRHNLQPADNSLLHPPRSIWPAEVVPLLRAAQQEGSGQRLDRRWKRQMAVDPGKSLKRKDGIPHWDDRASNLAALCQRPQFPRKADIPGMILPPFFVLLMNPGSTHSSASEAALQLLKTKKKDVFWEIPPALWLC